MILKPLKRAPLPDNATAELVEPSAGTATAFVSSFQKFPTGPDGQPAGNMFVGLRALICLYDNGKPFLPQLVNALHEQNPETWPVAVLEADPVRAVLEALDTSYLVRLVDYFLDATSSTQLAEINAVIRDQIWPDVKEKNG